MGAHDAYLSLVGKGLSNLSTPDWCGNTSLPYSGLGDNFSGRAV